MDDPRPDNGLLQRRRMLRIYLSGLVVLAILYLGWRLIYELLPWIERFDDPFLAFLITGLALLFLPLMLGLIMEYWIHPLMGRWHSGAALLELQDRLTSGLADGHQPQVVLVNHPDDSVRSFAVLTARYPASGNGQELAAVFVPWGPQSRRGKFFVVPAQELVVTDWTFQQLQLFLISYGTLGPETLDVKSMVESGIAPPE